MGRQHSFNRVCSNGLPAIVPVSSDHKNRQFKGEDLDTHFLDKEDLDTHFLEFEGEVRFAVAPELELPPSAVQPSGRSSFLG